MLSRTLDQVVIDEPKGLLDVLVETNLASSKREARTFVQSGAIMINDLKMDDIEFVINKEHAMHGEYAIVRRGKKKYAMILFK
jgi:tyrosyl-tRNA synthetase